MPGLTRILSLFRSEFNKLNNTGAWMLEYIYHMMKSNFWRHYVRNDVMDVITFPKLCKPLVVCQFYCMALFHQISCIYLYHSWSQQALTLKQSCINVNVTSWCGIDIGTKLFRRHVAVAKHIARYLYASTSSIVHALNLKVICFLSLEFVNITIFVFVRH